MGALHCAVVMHGHGGPHLKVGELLLGVRHVCTGEAAVEPGRRQT